MARLTLAFIFDAFNASDASPLVKMLLPAGLVLVLLGMIMSMRSRRRKNAARPSAREQLERGKQTRGMQSDLEELMVEIERLTRRFASQVDAKTVELESLIREADQRIAELRRLSDAARSSTAGATTQALRDRMGSTPEPVDPLTRNVFDLADEGLPSVEIARRLNEHVGKVELILALRKTQ